MFTYDFFGAFLVKKTFTVLASATGKKEARKHIKQG